jgi:hypothetical protein
LFVKGGSISANEWSKSEKEIARRAFDLAYVHECKAIEEELRKRVANLHDPKGLWSLHPYLSEQGRDIDRKYDYRYSVLISVFARLLDEGWIMIDDISGLSEKKIEAIRGIVEFSNE